MATYETASTLQDVADRMVASQELEPGYGWNYTALETAARGGIGRRPRRLDHHGVRRAVDLRGRGAGHALRDRPDEDARRRHRGRRVRRRRSSATSPTSGPTVGRSLAQSLGFGATPDYDFYMTDLGDAGRRDRRTRRRRGEADAVDRGDRRRRPQQDRRSRRPGARAGMAIYFPPQQAAFNAEYTASTAAAHLDRVPEQLLRRPARPAAGRPSSRPPQAQSQFANGGFVIGQQVVSDINQITDVYISYGYVECGRHRHPDRRRGREHRLRRLRDRILRHLPAVDRRRLERDVVLQLVRRSTRSRTSPRSASRSRTSPPASDTRIAGVPADELRAEHRHDPLRDVLRPG